MYTVDSSQEKFSVSKYNSFRMQLSGCDFFDRKREQIGPASNKKVWTAEPVLWSRSRKEPKLFVGAGTGAGAVYSEVSAPVPGQTNVLYKNHNSYWLG
jgi:hypothetical protein